MKSLLQNLVRASIVAGLSLVVTLSAAAQGEPEGIVRITKLSNSDVQQVVSAVSFGHHGALVAGPYSNCDCQYGYGHGYAGCPYGHRGCDADLTPILRRWLIISGANLDTSFQRVAEAWACRRAGNTLECIRRTPTILISATARSGARRGTGCLWQCRSHPRLDMPTTSVGAHLPPV